MCKLILVLTAIVFYAGCNSRPHCAKTGINYLMLDSVKQHSDTSYSKRYKTSEFSVADYYLNHNDSTICQIMKDTSGNIRQIIITRKNIRKYYAEFFANGQVKANIPVDSSGNYQGSTIYYYESGCVKSTGNFQHGMYNGEWKNYDEKGIFFSTDIYDANGQLIKTILD